MPWPSNTSGYNLRSSYTVKDLDDEELDEQGAAPSPMGATAVDHVGAVDQTPNNPDALTYQEEVSATQGTSNQSSPVQQAQEDEQLAKAREDYIATHGDSGGGRMTLEDAKEAGNAANAMAASGTSGGATDLAGLLNEIINMPGIDADQRIADEKKLAIQGLEGNLADAAAQWGGAGFGQSGQLAQASMDMERRAADQFSRRAADIQDDARREKLERGYAAINMQKGLTDIEKSQLQMTLLEQVMSGDENAGANTQPDMLDQAVDKVQEVTEFVQNPFVQTMEGLFGMDFWRNNKYGDSDESVVAGMQGDGQSVASVQQVSDRPANTQRIHEVNGVNYYYDPETQILYKVG